MQLKHLVLFDGDCALCNTAVRHILQIDRKKIFCFAPLSGTTAKEVLGKSLQEFEKLNTLVLIENYKSPQKSIHIRSKAFFRILWLIGGVRKALGIFSFLPAFLGDFFYKIVAFHRHKIKGKAGKIDFTGDNRFLH